jgi:hypothetical protein
MHNKFDICRYENPPVEARWLRHDLFQIVYSQLENTLLVIRARYHSALHSSNKTHQLLEPFFAYLKLVKQDASDYLYDPSHFFQLQRFLFLLSNINVNDSLAYEILVELKEAYYTAAQCISKNLAIKGYQTWFRQDVARHPHSLTGILKWSETSKFLHVKDRQLDIQSIADEKILECFLKEIEQYLQREDHWYSRRANESILIATHLIGILIAKQDSIIKTIYESKLSNSSELLPTPLNEAPGAGVELQPAISPPKISANTLMYYYLLYQIVGFLDKPFSKKRDEDLDRCLFKYIYLISKKILLQNQGEDKGEYWMFLQIILHPKRFCNIVSNEVTDKKLKIKKVVYDKILPSIRILISLSRISDSMNCKSELTFQLPPDQYQFETFFNGLYFNFIEMFAFNSRKIFKDKFQNPKINRYQTYDPKIVHLFLACYFLLELKSLSGIEDTKIFWSIYTARSENTELKLLASFMYGSLAEFIGTFALYKYLIAEQAQIFAQYHYESDKVLQAGNLRALKQAIFKSQVPPDAHAQIEEIHKKIMLYINRESEC